MQTGMPRSRYRIVVALLIVLLTGTSLSAAGKYAVLTLEGSVNPVISDFLVKSMRQAAGDGAEFIVLQLDTPGGLMTSMREIIKAILTSNIPVIVFTYPKGAQASSAGGFIMLSAHIAVMAPGTEMGAMHPVSPMLDFMKKDERGDPGGIMEKKVLNDTVAYARSLAQKRKRNIDWAVDAVKKAVSATYKEALALGIIDLVAEDMNDLLKKLDGRKVEMNGTVVELHTKNLTMLTYQMNWKERLLNTFADPQIIFLLLIIAIAGIGIEFKSPGLIVPGVIGGIALFLFLMAIQVLPINIIGLLLIILAVVLFVLELIVTSHGLLTLGGVVAYIMGSMILFDSPLPGGHIPLSSIIGSAVLILLFIFIVLRSVLKAQRSRVSVGVEAMVGRSGVSLARFTGRGKIMIQGEIWNALSSQEIEKDDTVVVMEVRGLDLVVGKEQPPEEKSGE